MTDLVARPRAGVSFVAAALVAVALASLLPAAGCGVLAGPERKQAIALYEAGKFKEAIPRLKNVLRLRPGDGEARRVLALALTKNGDGNEAIDQWLRVLKAKPESADAHYWLGIAYLSTKRQRKAMEEWVKTIELDSTYVSAHYNLGLSYAEMGIMPLAVEQWSELLEIDPTHYQAHVNRGRLRVLQRDYTGGLEDFLIAIAIRPDAPINWLSAGESYFLLDDSTHAVAYIDSFLAKQQEDDEMAQKARELRRRILAGEKAPSTGTSTLGIVPLGVPPGSPDSTQPLVAHPDTTLK